MAETVEEQVTIDECLRFVFFGLECHLGVSFDGCECERVFRDAVNDMISCKEYAFYRSSRLAVSGRVRDYEPGEILLRVEGKRGVTNTLKGVMQGAASHAFRMRNAKEFSCDEEPDGEPVSDLS